ncbi:hypothetical protein NEUTE2DRAFT_76108 [Neurospora tetrasperma FGSC 2509]|nr:hypothetical protein NEUTE2DRAFT_76108 [Neurospora tetrasperma FGSC 2509]
MAISVPAVCSGSSSTTTCVEKKKVGNTALHASKETTWVSDENGKESYMSCAVCRRAVLVPVRGRLDLTACVDRPPDSVRKGEEEEEEKEEKGRKGRRGITRRGVAWLSLSKEYSKSPVDRQDKTDRQIQ